MPVRNGCILLVVWMMALAAVAREEPWEHERSTRDGIVVYSRTVPGTTVREVRATLVVDAPPLPVLDAAADPESFRETNRQYVTETRVYSGERSDVWYNYQVVRFPVIDRRDYCLRYVRTIDEERQIYRLSWDTSDRFGPGPREDIVRVTLARGAIDIRPTDGGRRSKVRYTLLADPGGNIPDWLINLANRTSVPDILRQMRDAAVARAGKRPPGGL